MASLLDEATANVRHRRRATARRWLERHPTARTLARGTRWAWRRRSHVATGAKWAANGFRPMDANAVQCAHCRQSIPLDKVESHLNGHNPVRTRKARARDQRAAQPTFSPRRPRPAPPSTGTPRRPAPQTATAPPRPAPAVAPLSSTTPPIGRTRPVGTQETTALTRAARIIGEMDPATAWDLDAQLAGMSTAVLALAENVGQWIERLDAIKTDPRVTGPAANAIAELAEVSGTFTRTRRTFRTLYAAQFEAAETNVRQIRRENFWDQNAA
jgi:hypothetical protein